MRKKILLGFLLLLTTTIGSIPAYSDNGVTDKDNDSIPDNVDFCPNLPEDFEDEIDGCPDSAGGVSQGAPDRDGDGIPDRIDSCPSQPETFNGILDLDGCPDKFTNLIDTDRDGIHDSNDN